MSIKLRKNLLIICEGTVTEPNYIHDIRDHLISKNIKYTIEIRPKPTKEEAEPPFKLREGATKRTLNETEGQETDFVEDEYSAQPIRYVREAQLGLIDDTFDEAWAVFDKDQHPKCKEAFLLSENLINGKQVNIGFSHISFETWILLHFELCTTPFAKTQCRKQDEIFNCGTLKHPDDCNGSLCVSGYIKEKEYLDRRKNIKNVSFYDLESKVYVALENAVRLRQQSILRTVMPLYDYNPFTLMDRLVFKLLNLPLDYIWINLEEANVEKMQVTVIANKTVLEIKFSNTTKASVIILSEHVSLVNAFGQRNNFLERKVINPEDEFYFKFDILGIMDFRPLYISFKKSKEEYLISELPKEIFKYLTF